MSYPMSIPTTSPRSPKAMVRSISLTEEETSAMTSTPTLELEQEQEHVQVQVQQRRVRFLDARVVGIIAPRSSITIEEHQRVWYPIHELDGFKTEIRNMCRKIREDRQQQQLIAHISGNTAANAATTDSPAVLTRGLEHRICKNRQRNKAIAIWGTLKAQQRNNDPEFIAMIARKCTMLAKELAITEATRDYCEVYNPDAIALLLPQIESVPSNPFPIKLKRKCSSATTIVIDGGCGTTTNARNVRTRSA